ncbi:MAG: hypothetical protein Q4D26_04175 [Clostridia bacterium]|nr:hypothetical protein [Clostridia bacterium]
MASKIFVVKLKDVIKTGIFAVLGIIIIAAIIAFFSGSNKSAYKEGTYNSEIILQGKSVALSVTVGKNEIESISLEPLNETQEVFYPTFNSCIDEISQQVIELQSTDIELNKDYEVTGSILLDAIDSALAQASR